MVHRTHRSRRRALLVLAGGVVAATGGAALSGPGAGASTDQTVTVAYNATGDFPEPATTLKAAKASFEAEHPGVTVDLQEEIAADEDFHTKIQLRLQSGGDVPDVVYYSPNWLDADAAAGYLSPLKDDLAAWPDWTEQFPEAVRAGAASADGSTYGMPLSANDIGIWYNRDVFAAAGLPEDWHPTSWADLARQPRRSRPTSPMRSPCISMSARRPASPMRSSRRSNRSSTAPVTCCTTSTPTCGNQPARASSTR